MDRKTEQSADKAQSTEKRPYQRPELVNHGRVEDSTRQPVTNPSSPVELD